MERLVIPNDYKSELNIKLTQGAIKSIKDHFERQLARLLNLTRVSAPLFVYPESGLNDNLNGVERPVRFGVKEQNDREVEIVHSLAKWHNPPNYLQPKTYKFPHYNPPHTLV